MLIGHHGIDVVVYLMDGRKYDLLKIVIKIQIDICKTLANGTRLLTAI